MAKKLSQDGQELVRSMVIDVISDDEEALIEMYGLEPYRDAMGFSKRKKS